MRKLIFSVFIVMLLSSCVVVRPYERQYINDVEMQMNIDEGKSFNNYVNSIREGATPTGSSKGSGGCGCN